MTCGCSTTTSPSSLSTIMAFGGKRKYGKRYRSKKHHNRSTKTTTRTLYRKKRNHKTKGKKKKQRKTRRKRMTGGASFLGDVTTDTVNMSSKLFGTPYISPGIPVNANELRGPAMV